LPRIIRGGEGTATAAAPDGVAAEA